MTHLTPGVKLCECGCGQPAPIAKRNDSRAGHVKGQPVRFIQNHGGNRSREPRLFVEAGQRVGRSIVIDPDIRIQTASSSKRAVQLRCYCGNEFIRLMEILFRTDDPSCGCRSAQARTDKTGQRFGRLTAVHRVKGKPGSRADSDQWLCKCDCGGETVAAGRNLRRGHTKSCGCLKGGHGQDYPPGEAAFNKTLRSYRQNAQNRGRSWELTSDDFRRLTSLNCFYCGVPPSMITRGSRRGGDYVYNGLDRVDNTVGYTLENSLTCCKICNHAKRDMPYDEFLAWIARLTEYHWFHPEMMPSHLLAMQRQRAN